MKFFTDISVLILHIEKDNRFNFLVGSVEKGKVTNKSAVHVLVHCPLHTVLITNTMNMQQKRELAAICEW